jgi:hypothetical protein
MSATKKLRQGKKFFCEQKNQKTLNAYADLSG